MLLKSRCFFGTLWILYQTLLKAYIKNIDYSENEIFQLFISRKFSYFWCKINEKSKNLFLRYFEYDEIH